MGKRSEPRKPVQVQVRIFGTDDKGRVFSECVATVDVSRSGAKLAGVKAAVKVDEIIGLSYGRNKVHFRVKWTGKLGTPSEGQIGLLNLSPERPLWDFPLPVSISDNFQAQTLGERRRWVRVKCEVPVELQPDGSTKMYGRASDLGAGGCFVEMPIPLARDAKFGIALWIGENKLRLKGEVASCAPGFGIGVRFVEVSPQDREFLERHIPSLALHAQP
jgi:hypothetical protein